MLLLVVLVILGQEQFLLLRWKLLGQLALLP